MKHPCGVRLIRSLCVLPGALGLVACSGGSHARSASAAANVTVTPSHANVSVAAKGGEAKAIAVPTAATVGSAVVTDPTGRAELRYSDGSVARLDSGTTATIVALTDPNVGTRIGITVGRVWQRIQHVTQSQTNSVETPVGVAAVRGTTYVVECTTAPACTFTVIEGAVQVAPAKGTPVSVGPDQRVGVTPAGAAAVRTVTPAELLNDPFIADNLIRDNAELPTPPANSTPSAAQPTPEQTAGADLTGTYATTVTYTSAAGIFGETTGATDHRTYILRSDCSTVPCSVHVHVQETSLDLDLRGQGSQYSGTVTRTTDCLNAAGSVVAANAIQDAIALTLHASTATFTGGHWETTMFAGTALETLTATPAGQAAGCPSGRSTSTVDGTRT
jgi:hypothetical protein